MRHAQSGIALITAVLVVALAAIAASAILVSANLAIHRAESLQNTELAWWYADGVESWARTILLRDRESGNTDSFADIWATPVSFLPIDEGAISGGISDLQGRYNLNNLAMPDAAAYQTQLTVFVRLYRLATGGDDYQARALAAAIRDYVDSDSQPTGADGAEDSDYLSMKPPRRVPNRLMASVSELLAVRGITPEIYQLLQPHLCALPQYGVPVNVNTATPVLLMALLDQQTPSNELQNFLKERISKPVDHVNELFNERKIISKAEQRTDALMTVSSGYFELRTEVFVGSRRLALYSFLSRAGSATPTVYGRSTFTE